MYVYLVWQNDHLCGLYRDGAKAEKRLLLIKGRDPGGDWVCGGVRDEKDKYVQRWWQRHGPVARLAVEKEEIE